MSEYEYNFQNVNFLLLINCCYCLVRDIFAKVFSHQMTIQWNTTERKKIMSFSFKNTITIVTTAFQRVLVKPKRGCLPLGIGVANFAIADPLNILSWLLSEKT